MTQRKNGKFPSGLRELERWRNLKGIFKARQSDNRARRTWVLNRERRKIEEMNLIRGRDGEWQAATNRSRGYAGSIPTPASNFATGAEALTSAPAFNHTQPKLRGSKQPKLY